MASNEKMIRYGYNSAGELLHKGTDKELEISVEGFDSATRRRAVRRKIRHANCYWANKPIKDWSAFMDDAQSPSVVNKEEEQAVWLEQENTATLSGMARTPEELAAQCGVDLRVWEFNTVRVKGGKSAVTISGKRSSSGKDTTYYNPVKSMEVTFRRRKEFFDHEAFMAKIEKSVKAWRPKSVKTNKAKQEGEHMLEISLCDVHMGKLGFTSQTGTPQYNIHVAEERVLASMDHFLSKSVRIVDGIEKIVLVAGNDFFNSDHNVPSATTTKGTPQQEDIRWQDAYVHGANVWVTMVEKCRAIAPVTVITIPGNHDEQKSFYMSHYLKGWFKDCDDVVIHNTGNSRSYVSYGENLIGFGHGRESDVTLDRLKMLMQQEVKHDWAETCWREWHLGDIHHAKTIKFKDEDYQGLMIRNLKTIMGDDQWQSKKGYKSIRGGEAFLWSRSGGMTDNIHYNIPVNFDPAEDSDLIVKL